MRGIDAAGIHNVEGAPVPFDLTKQTVARGAGCIVHDGETFSDQAVE